MALVPVALLLAAAAAGPAAASSRNQVHVKSTRGDIGPLPKSVGEADQVGNFGGYQLLRVRVYNNASVDLLRQYEETPGVDFWTPPSHLTRTVDVMVSPDLRQSFTRQLTSNGIRYSVSISNVQDAIERENPMPSLVELELLEGRQGHRLTWTAYHRLDDHHQYLDYIAGAYRGLCDTFSIGSSTEGRQIKGIKCGLGQREVWIDGGIHAREWISPAVVSYIIKDFSENSYSAQDILREFTIYIIPVLNVDGYEYSHVGNRMWRKTRSRNPGSSCIGVDPNRNFDVHWAEVGSSSNPCSETYHGPRAFSEPETSAVRTFLLNHASKMDMYISFHSYSQMLFVPYAYGPERPADYSELKRVAELGAKALRDAGGPRFRVGQASRLLYAASGGSDDWAKAKAGIKYSYTFELRDTGRRGFLLQARLIEQSGRETSAAVQAMIRAIV